MFWRNKTLQYDILVPPIKKPIRDLSAAEASLFFTWFKEKIPHRIEYMTKRCSEQLGINKNKIDVTPDSLQFVWRWFLQIAEVERTPKRKVEYLVEAYRIFPYAFQEYLIGQEKDQFSLQTEYILMDIGMYIGEVFIRNNPTLFWGYYTEPKTDFSVNRPVLLGFLDDRFTPPFSTEFDPIHMVGVQAANIWDNTQNENDLLQLYNKWKKFIPSSEIGQGTVQNR